MAAPAPANTQLTDDEISLVRSLRQDDELTFDEIADKLGVDVKSAHRILTIPGYTFSELLLIRIRKGLDRVRSDRKQSRRKATV